jgi:hypothetical protein
VAGLMERLDYSAIGGRGWIGGRAGLFGDLRTGLDWRQDWINSMIGRQGSME